MKMKHCFLTAVAALYSAGCAEEKPTEPSRFFAVDAFDEGDVTRGKSRKSN